MQPNTCWTCKSPDVPRLMNEIGVAEFYKGKWEDKGHEIVNPIGCADCHIPYMSEGGQKFTDHHIQSPLNNVNNSCQVCHRDETEKLVNDVNERHKRVIENRDKLEKQIVSAHVEAKTAWNDSATEPQMKDILMDIRHAQWRWDYTAASHGASFHSPVETSRVIASGMDIIQDARLKLARVLADLGHNKPVPYPDISTKAKAQEYIGLDMDKLNHEKQRFLEEVVPIWEQKAKEREKNYEVSYY